MKPLFTLVGALAVSLAASSTAETIAGSTPDLGAQRRLEADVRFLADDLLEGRATPSRGLDVAALYLANQMRAAGWEPAYGDSYFQTHTVARFAPEEAHYRVRLNGQELEPSDYVLFPQSFDPRRTPLRLDLVFAGHGVFLPEKDVDDYAGLDVAGKAVVALLGAPWPLDPAVIHAPDRAVGKDVSATVRGARLLVYVSEDFAAENPTSAEVAVLRHYAKAPVAFLPEADGRPSWAAGPSLVLTPSAFDRTLAGVAGGRYVDLRQRLAAGARLGRPLPATVEIVAEARLEERPAANVVAALRGSDPARRDEWIVLSAHYDHVGRVEVPEGEDGIFNGADDNASGTAAVLEVARRLGGGPRLSRSVLALLTAGEDMGLLGAAHYALHPLVPWRQVVANVNLDMVGRSRGSVIAIAPGSEEVFARAVSIGRDRGIEVRPDQTPLWRLIYFCDAYHFAWASVPVVTFFTELHADYHQPSDEADKIRYPELARIVSVIEGVVTHYVGDVPRPRFERPAWFLTPPESPAAAADAKGGRGLDALRLPGGTPDREHQPPVLHGRSGRQ
jgi:hypothetical protein